MAGSVAAQYSTVNKKKKPAAQVLELAEFLECELAERGGFEPPIELLTL